MTEHSTFIFRDKYTLKLWVGHKEWVGLKQGLIDIVERFIEEYFNFEATGWRIVS